MTRPAWIFIALGALATLGAASFGHPTPRWIWNASASVPEGLYHLQRTTTLQVGDLVAAAPPEPLASFLAARRYLPRDALLMKHVAALPGQTVCRAGLTVRIDGAWAGQALPRDRRGRRLPDWQGCRALTPGQVFLMNRAVSDSLDGRYFGALPAATVLGRATPIWLRPAADTPGPSRHAVNASPASTATGDPNP
jgi:conjugative transfer signal peptidase TraF